jgi:hypothetical protein
MKIKRTILIIVLLMILVGCGKDGPDKEVIIKDVVRIFYHEEDKYTFMIQEEGSQEIISLTVYFRFYSSNKRLHIITDVEPCQKMWVKYTSYYSRNLGEVTKNAEIHIHSSQDISGGGWDHGKFGSGTTSVLQ